MSGNSKIEWTEKTWNPTTGCIKVSQGCKNCYAESLSKRLKAMGAVGYENGFELSLMPSRLEQPLKRRTPTTYFVNSMSDLFWEQIPNSYLDQVFEVINDTPHHTYQILTKRADRMVDYFHNRNVPQNAWLGVSVENQKQGLPRIDQLRKVEATIRFLSVEPLLEDLGKINLTDIHWVIVGGESGPNARPMKQDWALSVRDQCIESGAQFFFKQWGGWGADGVRRQKNINGRRLDGKLYDNYPTALTA